MKGEIYMIVVRQRDEKDCGVCALLSIIRHHKGNVPLEKIRLDAKTTNEGTTALNLILASQKYGFEAVGVKLNNIYDIKQFPAIAHMNLKKGYTHYVVIEKITKDKIVIMDPAKGKVVMKVNDFICEWSNVVLLFYPKKKIIVLKNEVTIFKLFTRVMKSEKGLIKIIIFVSFLLMLLSILLGYYFQILFSSITNGYSYKYLKIIVIIFLIFTIFKIILSFYRTYLENHLNKNIDCLLNSDFLSHLYNLPLNVITSRNAGEIISRVNDLTSIKNIITEIFMSSTLDLILVAIAVPLLINISKNLFLILFLMIILYFLIGLIFSKAIFKRAYQNISYEADFNNNLIEDIKMINSIKNLNVISPALKKLEYKLTNYLYDSYLLNIVINKEKTLKSIIYEIGFFIINTYGLYLLYKSKISLINIITFNTLLSLFLDPLKNIVDSIPKYCYMKATISKINDFLSLKKENLGNIEETYGYELRFKNLTYSYNKFESIIKNFNLVIPEGNFILLKGPSGSGKSTICNILNKYINDYDGNILLGAINIKDLSINTIRKNIIYVNQNENIFSGTIRENIVLDKKISEVDFQYISYLCKIDEIVKKRPLRFETFISPDENNLSGGERQRIILARALLNNFNILLLDEALSEVDMKLELSILKNMRKIYKDKTIIYISHKKYPKIFDNVINLGSSICHT